MIFLCVASFLVGMLLAELVVWHYERQYEKLMHFRARRG